MKNIIFFLNEGKDAALAVSVPTAYEEPGQIIISVLLVTILADYLILHEE